MSPCWPGCAFTELKEVSVKRKCQGIFTETAAPMTRLQMSARRMDEWLDLCFACAISLTFLRGLRVGLHLLNVIK